MAPVVPRDLVMTILRVRGLSAGDENDHEERACGDAFFATTPAAFKAANYFRSDADTPRFRSNLDCLSAKRLVSELLGRAVVPAGFLSEFLLPDAARAEP